MGQVVAGSDCSSYYNVDTALVVTDTFRSSDESLFFEWDGHFNQAGHRLFAEAIAPTVAEMCARIAEEN